MTDVLMDIAAEGVAASVKKNLKRKTPDQVAKALDGSFRYGEMIERKRVVPVTFRLHAAKYLSMDKMLKNMFFPLRTLQNPFGLTSYSGCNRLDAADMLGITKDAAGNLRTKGNYRGLALFTIRDTNTAATPTADNCLNGDPKQLGAVNSPNVFEGKVDSIYRSFHNGPPLVGASTGTVVYDGTSVLPHDAQTLVNTDSLDQTQSRSLSMGINLSQIEKAALNAMCYADPVVSSGRLAIPATPVAQLDNTELVPGQTGIQNYSNSPFTDETPQNTKYNYQVANGVCRIVDGSLVMDIMNTENTPCVVEVVIHSKKKNNLSKSTIYNHFREDYERVYAAKGVTSGFTAADANTTGGWQTFYDPEVPLLKLPKSSNVYNFVSEVHRSHHILAPGQSKLVTIKLGSLWYKIANKNDLLTGGSYPNKTIVSFEDSVGTLFVAVGHSGFNAPQGIQAVMNGPAGSGNIYSQAFMSPESAYPIAPLTNVRGAGWWAGMTHAPSSLIISGNYKEQFYPMTFDRSEPVTSSGFVGRGAVFESFSDATKRSVVPVTHILPEKVVTSDSTFKSNSFKEEL